MQRIHNWFLIFFHSSRSYFPSATSKPLELLMPLVHLNPTFCSELLQAFQESLSAFWEECEWCCYKLGWYYGTMANWRWSWSVHQSCYRGESYHFSHIFFNNSIDSWESIPQYSWQQSMTPLCKALLSCEMMCNSNMSRQSMNPITVTQQLWRLSTLDSMVDHLIWLITSFCNGLIHWGQFQALHNFWVYVGAMSTSSWLNKE